MRQACFSLSAANSASKAHAAGQSPEDNNRTTKPKHQAAVVRKLQGASINSLAGFLTVASCDQFDSLIIIPEPKKTVAGFPWANFER